MIILGYVGALILLVTGGYHLTGVTRASEGFVGEQRGLSRGAWIILAGDWFLIAAAWIAAGLKALPNITFAVGASFPLMAAIVLSQTIGIRFTGVWLLSLAGLCGLAAGI